MKRVAYYTNESFYNSDQRGFVVAKVTENEAGYEETFGLHKTVEAAEYTANKLNQQNGLLREDVLDIVASSMRLGRVR